MLTGNALRRNAGLVLSVCLLSTVVAMPSRAEITVDPDGTGAGDVLPANPKNWQYDELLIIGSTGRGVVQVDGGSRDTMWVTLGDQATGDGELRVAGEGSGVYISTDYSLTVGNWGQGRADVTGGAYLRHYSIYGVDEEDHIARQAGSSGVLTIRGADSSGQFNYLHVGHGGAGELRLSDGATAEMWYVYGAGLAGSSAHIQVSGAGTSLTVEKEIALGGAGQATMIVSDGGQFVAGEEYHSNSASVLAGEVGSSADVTVTGAGSSWQSFGGLIVGDAGSARFDVAGGATMEAEYLTLGQSAGGSGTVSIAGAGAIPETFSSVTVGQGGSGELTVSGGASLQCWGLTIAQEAGSTGRATVTGAGTGATVSQGMTVGGAGQGELVVGPGAQVDVYGGPTILGAGAGGGTIHFDGGTLNTSGFIGGFDQLSGTGVINTTGLVSDVDLVFDAAHPVDAPRTYTVDDGLGGTVTVNLNIDRSGPMGVAYSGAASMRIADGQALSSDGGYVGYAPGSYGQVTITGTNSRWSSRDRNWSSGGPMEFGVYGRADLLVEGGATVGSSSVVLGHYAGSIGTATITGTGSRWDLSSGLAVGQDGTGTLTVADGAAIESHGGWIGWGVGGSGEMTVTDAGTKWTLSHHLIVGGEGTGSLVVDHGASVELNASLTLGEHGTGTLAIRDGAYVNVSGYTKVAMEEGSHGGIDLQNGTLTTGVLQAGASQLTGTGTIITKGLIGDVDVTIDAAHPADGQHNLTLTGGQSPGIAIQWNMGQTHPDVGFGYTGAGSMHLSEGEDVSCPTGYLGYWSGASGSATVSGSGTSWLLSEELFVGLRGQGELTVSDGGKVDCEGTLYIGRYAGAQGTATVSGADSHIESNWLAVGHEGEGTLTVSGGATVRTWRSGRIGYLSGSGGSALITGAGSAWTMSQELSIGLLGDGSLTVADGATVTASYMQIGRSDTDTQASVTVTGAGSSLLTTTSYASELDLFGEMTIADGGSVEFTHGLQTHYLQSGVGGLLLDGGTLTLGGPLMAGADQLQGTGTIYATGLVSDVDLVFDAAHPVAASRDITFDALAGQNVNLHLDLSAPGRLGAGYGGTGSLRVADGQVLECEATYAGYLAGSNGTIEVTGAGTVLHSSNAPVVGVGGRGELTISNGAVVTNDYGSRVLGSGAGSTGIATITGAGSRWDNLLERSDSFYVGLDGQGQMTIADGGQVNDVNIDGESYIAEGAGSAGTVLVTGTDSQWNLLRGYLVVGFGGEGALTIAAGGEVNAKHCAIGVLQGSSGTVTVTGAGSTFTTKLSYQSCTGDAELIIGYAGRGEMLVERGGSVYSKWTRIGAWAGDGTATVTGAGSTWVNSQFMWVGEYSHGDLTVSDGGLVTTNGLSIGDQEGSLGQVTVTGANSLLDVADLEMYVGFEGRGELTIADGAEVRVKDATWVAGNLPASGVIHLDGGTLTTGGLFAAGSDLTGTGVINTAGMFSDVLDGSAQVFDATHPVSQPRQYVLTEGGKNVTINVAGGTSSPRGAGFAGAGTMRIADGVMLVSCGGVRRVSRRR